MESNFCWLVHIEAGLNPHQAWNGLKVALLAMPCPEQDDRISVKAPTDYDVTSDVGDNGEFVHIEIRFKTEVNAVGFYDNAKGLQGIFVACDYGEMNVHECHIPGEGCRIIKSMEK